MNGICHEKSCVLSMVVCHSDSPFHTHCVPLLCLDNRHRRHHPIQQCFFIYSVKKKDNYLAISVNILTFA